MTQIELLILAIGLSMDAFAVSITNGLCIKNIKWKDTLSIALCFGLFQGAMPVIGFFLGSAFTDYITRIDHYIALVLLGFIGGKMLVDGFKNEEESCELKKLTFGSLMLQGVATSIDALAVGVSLAAMNVNIISASAFICLVTFSLCLLAVRFGKKFGSKLGNKAQIIGGLILIALGLKIFIEHTFFQ